MKLIEIETKMGKDGIIQIPKAELEATGLKEGDEVCLLYVNNEEGGRVNCTGEFILQMQENHNIE